MLLLVFDVFGSCPMFVGFACDFKVLYNMLGLCVVFWRLRIVCWGFVQSVGALYSLLGLSRPQSIPLPPPPPPHPRPLGGHPLPGPTAGPVDVSGEGGAWPWEGMGRGGYQILVNCILNIYVRLWRQT